MRWSVALLMVLSATLISCGRVQKGEVATVAPPPLKPRQVVKAKAQPEALPATAEPQQLPPTEATQPTPPPEAQPPAEKQPAPEAPPLAKGTVPQQPTVQQPSAAPLPEAVPIGFADEARSVRASADTLQSQFDRLPIGEIRARLLLLNQAVSELEVRAPALVLWRTALRLELLSKAPYPDVAAGRSWLARARSLLAEQKVGMTTLEKAESALKAGDWKGAATALRETANKLNATEQADALSQARISLLNALEALERQKGSVAKAEVGEAVKALDRFIATLP